MGITRELEHFLNKNAILDLIAAKDWRELFSKAEVNLANDILTLHKILVNSNLTSTDELLQKLDHVPVCFFKQFDALTSITLPDNVTSIGYHAFQNCKNFETKYFNGTKDQWKLIKKGQPWKDGTNEVKIIFK